MIMLCVTGTADRFHGFLRSIMLNPHPGVYVSRDIDRGARDRIWSILSDWHAADPRGMVLMIHPDKSLPMGIALSSLGAPKREIIDLDGHYALRRTASDQQPERLDTESTE